MLTVADATVVRVAMEVCDWTNRLPSMDTLTYIRFSRGVENLDTHHACESVPTHAQEQNGLFAGQH